MTVYAPSCAYLNNLLADNSICTIMRILEQSSGGPRSAPHDGLSHCGIFFVVLRNLDPIHHGPPFLDV